MKWLIGSALALSFSAHANTFVGNGGSQGDVELAVTMMQIQEGFQAIENKSDDQSPLCTCTPTYTGRAICEPLVALNEAQSAYCSKTLYEVAPAILKLLEKRENIHILWTNSAIEVEEGGKKRAADAVANRAKNEITINQPRFLAMQQTDRVFLLTHELLHFADHAGKPLEDRGAIGPFGGDDGSRSLVNAMSAANAQLQGTHEVKRYRAKLLRSQSWKKFWFAADVGTAHASKDYNSQFQFNEFARVNLSFRYQLSDFGLVLAYRNEKAGHKAFDTIQVDHEFNIFGAGLSYRHFFFKDPITFWGQSHLVAQLMAEAFKSDYKIDDGGAPNQWNDSKNGFGGSFSLNYYLPIFWGFWGYAGIGYEMLPVKHALKTSVGQDIEVNYNSNLTSGWIGVSYAF